MDMNENTIKAEVSNLVNVLKSYLPKKKYPSYYIELQKAKVTKLGDVHAEAKNVFPRCFLGAKIVVLREIMDRVKLVQDYNFGKHKEVYPCFTHLLHNEMEPKTNDKVLIDHSGSVTASYSEVIEGSYEMRLTSKIRDLISSETEIVFEKETEKTIGSVSCSMKDVDPNNVRLVTQWMYKLHPNFSLGAEVGIKPLSYPPLPEYSISARFQKSSYVVSSTVAKTGFQICLFKQFAPDLRLATIVSEGYRRGPATLGLALHKSYENGSELKIFFDTQRCGGFTFQKDMYFYEPQNEERVVRLVASTLIDKQRRVRLGIGFHLDF